MKSKHYIQKNVDIISMKRQIKYYEHQLNGMENFLNQNNVKSINDLIIIINEYKILKINNSPIRR